MRYILDMLRNNCKPFATATYCKIQIPTYPSGECGIILARNHGNFFRKLI